MLGFPCFVEAKNTFTISNLFILSQHAVGVNLLLQKNLKKNINEEKIMIVNLNFLCKVQGE